ncbi:energy transducer TonB [Terracidiphilus sp.]|uniref:energy transducer TonB n=1 Tax=Terracidiphilus sp. TaxID=1964191 RepID=UPI003C1CC9E7
MRRILFFMFALSLAVSCSAAHADGIVKRVQKAVAISTLDRPGTHPFHLKAMLAPSLDRDKDSGRTGLVEIWWKSPTEWRREVSCPGFHQVQIISGGQTWQKNDGDYFPNWLREITDALMLPVPLSADLYKQMDSGEVKQLPGRTLVRNGQETHTIGMTHLSWTILSSNGEVQKGMGASIALNDQTGLLLYGGGFGWSGEFHDYQEFHKRQVARTVSGGSPEVTAKIIILEDLHAVQNGWFTAGADGDPYSIQIEFPDELDLRKNLLPQDPTPWPPTKDGPLEGVLTTEVSIDRTGAVRETGTIVSDNQSLNDAARTRIEAMRFKPFVLNGAPVQVLSRITLAFKTVRPDTPVAQ